MRAVFPTKEPVSHEPYKPLSWDREMLSLQPRDCGGVFASKDSPSDQKRELSGKPELKKRLLPLPACPQNPLWVPEPSWTWLSSHPPKGPPHHGLQVRGSGPRRLFIIFAPEPGDTSNLLPVSLGLWDFLGMVPTNEKFTSSP